MGGMYEGDQPMKIAELGETIFVAESTKTPLTAMIKTGKRPSQMHMSWPCKKYPSRSFAGSVDGTDITTFDKTTREEIEAYGMWMMSKGWMVSKLANLTQAAGVGRNEKGEQMADDALLLALQIEQQMLSDDDTVKEVMPGTPYQSRAIFSWLSDSAQTNVPVPANFRPAAACNYSGTLADFTPAAFRTMLEAMASAKKGPVDLQGFVGIAMKQAMSLWGEKRTPAASEQFLQQINIEASKKTLMWVVDSFEFDSGTVKTIPTWNLLCTRATGEASAYTTRSGMFIDLSMWEKVFLQEPMAWMEPPKSGGPRGYHDAVYALKCLNPLGQGMAKISS